MKSGHRKNRFEEAVCAWDASGGPHHKSPTSDADRDERSRCTMPNENDEGWLARGGAVLRGRLTVPVRGEKLRFNEY